MAPVARRVCLIGAESTGKTELARALSASFVPEFARQYAIDAGRALDSSDVGPIARGQIALMDGAAPADPIILDTDLLSTVVYAHHYYGACPPWIEEEARRRLADVYLLMDIDVPWIADAARDANTDRGAVHRRFVDTLRAFGARSVVIGGSWKERKARALEALHSLHELDR